PWWERRRGLAVSIAFNGATLGGVLVAPALIPLIGAVGFPAALDIAALGLLVVLVPVAAGVMRRAPAELGVGPDGGAGAPARVTSSPTGERECGASSRDVEQRWPADSPTGDRARWLESLTGVQRWRAKSPTGKRRWRGDALRMWRFWSVSA